MTASGVATEGHPYSETGSQPEFTSIGRWLTASRTAYFASSLVESSTGNGELAAVTISGISVQPRITHSAPLDFKSSIAPKKRSVVLWLKIPKHSSSKIAAFSRSRNASSGISFFKRRVFNADS